MGNMTFLYKLKDFDTLYEYMRLDQEQTGLDNEILVDDCRSYKRDNHQLLIFVRNGRNEYVLISVERQPQILEKNINMRLSDSEMEKILSFISTNFDLLYDFANEKVNVADFVKSINKFDESVLKITDNRKLKTDNKNENAT